MTDRVYAEMLAERIAATLTERCLEWGQAINRAEAAKQNPNEHARLVKLAQSCGLEVAQLSAGLAEKLRPLDK